MTTFARFTVISIAVFVEIACGASNSQELALKKWEPEGLTIDAGVSSSACSTIGVVFHENPWRTETTGCSVNIPFQTRIFRNSPESELIYYWHASPKNRNIRIIQRNKIYYGSSGQSLGIDLSSFKGDKLVSAGVKYIKNNSTVMFNDASSIPDRLIAAILRSKATGLVIVIRDYHGKVDNIIKLAAVQNQIKLLHISFPQMSITSDDSLGRSIRNRRTSKLVRVLQMLSGIEFFGLSSDSLYDTDMTVFEKIKNRIAYFDSMGTLCRQNCINLVSQFKALRQLSLRLDRLTGSLVGKLGYLTKLRKLWLRFRSSDELTTSTFELLNALESFNVFSATAGDNFAEVLCGLSQLKNLDLSHTKLSDSGLSKLACLRGLRNLNIASTRVTDKGLERLSKIKSLKSLNISNTNAVGPALLRLISHGALRRLRISNTNVTLQTLSSIASTKKLLALDLSKNPHLKGNMYVLSRTKGSLEALDLSDIQLSSRDIRVVSTLENLMWLSLNNVALKAGELSRLQSLKKVEHFSNL